MIVHETAPKRTLANRGKNRKSGYERPIFRSAVEMLNRLGYTFDGKVGWRVPADALKDPRVLNSMVKMLASKLASVERTVNMFGKTKDHDDAMWEQIATTKKMAIRLCYTEKGGEA